VRTPAERRLRGAFAFSLVVALALGLDFFLLSRPSGRTSGPLAVLTVWLALAAVLSVWTLVGSLLSVRPAWRHALGRCVWLWTFVYCAAAAYLGLGLSIVTAPVASWLRYALALLAVLVGAPVLVWSLVPPRRQRDFYGRLM
jgi:hypothetical protein